MLASWKVTVQKGRLLIETIYSLPNSPAAESHLARYTSDTFSNAGRRSLTFSFIALTPLHCQIGLLEQKDCARGFFIPAMILFMRREKEGCPPFVIGERALKYAKT